MPKENIKYKNALTKAVIMSIRGVMQIGMESKRAEYDSILSGFSVSTCMQAESLRIMIEKEKLLLDEMINLYSKLLTMLENAAQDIDTTEQAYSTEHIEGTLGE